MAGNTWAQDQRRDFITERLREAGRVIRRDLFEKFGVSEMTATKDFRAYEAAFPDAMVYDQDVRGYVRGPDFDKHHAAVAS